MYNKRMFNRLFGRRGRKPKVSIVFDIGSDSVAGSVVHFTGNSEESPRIIYSKRTHWHSENQSSYEDILRSMKYTLGNVARVIQEKNFPISRGSEIYVTFSAPWFANETRRAELSRKTVFTVTKNILDKIKDKEIKSFYKEGEKVYGEDFEVIEKSIIDVSVNGYPTDKPVGKKTKNINMSIYVSVAPKDVIYTVRDVLGRVLHHNISFHTTTLTSYIVSRDYFARDKDYIFMNIGGELTDLLVVRNNTIFQSLSFPLGLNFFYKHMASSLESSTHEVESLLLAAQNKHLHGETQKNVEGAKAKAYKAYEKHLESVFRQLSSNYKLPQDIYLSGFDLFDSDFRRLIESEHFGLYSMLDIPFDVTFINKTKIHTYLRYQDGIKRDLFVSLSVLYLNHI
ncbi:MAG: cell division ATPase FtsA [Candidatus Paceibacteria bacterium]|jgi:cell division ATPase FtsA